MRFRPLFWRLSGRPGAKFQKDSRSFRLARYLELLDLDRAAKFGQQEQSGAKDPESTLAADPDRIGLDPPWLV